MRGNRYLWLGVAVGVLVGWFLFRHSGGKLDARAIVLLLVGLPSVALLVTLVLRR